MLPTSHFWLISGHLGSQMGHDFGGVVQSLSRVQFFVTTWTAAHQASLSFSVSWSLLKLMFIELVMPSNHLILCRLTPSPLALNLSQHQGLFQ